VITLSSGSFRLLVIARRAPVLRGKMPRAAVASLGPEESDVNRQRAEVMAPQLHADSSDRDPWASLISYSIASGTVALTVGAIVSLVVAESDRFVLWAATTAAMAVAAGIIRESRVITACRLACHRLLRRLAQLSPTS